MARGPKKPRWFMKKNPRDRQNQQNGDDKQPRKRKLNMGRERIFKLELEEALEKSENDNTGPISATVLNKASQKTIGEAKDYLKKLEGDQLEKPVINEVNSLLDRYSVMR